MIVIDSVSVRRLKTLQPSMSQLVQSGSCWHDAHLFVTEWWLSHKFKFLGIWGDMWRRQEQTHLRVTCLPPTRLSCLGLAGILRARTHTLCVHSSTLNCEQRPDCQLEGQSTTHTALALSLSGELCHFWAKASLSFCQDNWECLKRS